MRYIVTSIQKERTQDGSIACALVAAPEEGTPPAIGFGVAAQPVRIGGLSPDALAGLDVGSVVTFSFAAV